MSDKKSSNAALDATVAAMDKQFGAGSVMRLGSSDIAPVRDGVIPTGSIALDAALGVGGLPRGRVIEIFGPESCGKTTLALHVIANAQKAGGTAVFIDAEHALDPVYAKALGVNTDAPVVPQEELAFQATMAVRMGWNDEAAYRGLTIEPAKALMIADRVGSLEVGKGADVVVSTGSILDPRHYVVPVYIDDKVAYDVKKDRRRF